MDQQAYQFLIDISIIYFSGVVFTFIAGWIWNNFTAIKYHVEPCTAFFSWLVPIIAAEVILFLSFIAAGGILFLSFSYIATKARLWFNLSTRYQSFRRWYRRDDVKQ